jgi:hypothetical protein
VLSVSQLATPLRNREGTIPICFESDSSGSENEEDLVFEGARRLKTEAGSSGSQKDEAFPSERARRRKEESRKHQSRRSSSHTAVGNRSSADPFSPVSSFSPNRLDDYDSSNADVNRSGNAMAFIVQSSPQNLNPVRTGLAKPLSCRSVSDTVEHHNSTLYEDVDAERGDDGEDVAQIQAFPPIVPSSLLSTSLARSVAQVQGYPLRASKPVNSPDVSQSSIILPTTSSEFTLSAYLHGDGSKGSLEASGAMVLPSDSPCTAIDRSPTSSLKSRANTSASDMSRPSAPLVS